MTQDGVSDGDGGSTPDVAGSETVQPETTPETIQPTEPKCSPDGSGDTPETDMKNPTICDALSGTTKLVLGTYIMVLLLESYPRMHTEWDEQGSRIRQNLVLPSAYKQDRPHLQTPICYEQHMMTVDSRLFSLTNPPLQSVSSYIMCMSQDPLAGTLTPGMVESHAQR